MSQDVEYSAEFKRNYVAFFALFLFFAMVIGELVVALAIPAFVSRENAFADEIRKREMMIYFDLARKKCQDIPESSEALRLEKMLLSGTLDDLAIYLRKEADDLTPEEVNELSPLVDRMLKTVIRLGNGKPYSRENRIDPAAYLDSLIAKRTERKNERN